MADTTTTNLGLTKPEVGASADTWGGKLNTNLDTIDGIFAGAGSGTSVGLNVGTGKTLTVGGTQNMSALTASTALALDASKNVVSVTNTGTGNNVLSASPTFTGTISGAAASLSGNLTFSSTGQRITGDFSNATVSNRLIFQTSTVSGNTAIATAPNAAAGNSSFNAFNASDVNNSSFAGIGVIGSTDVRLQAGILGTGTYLPMTFYTGGSERMRLDTSGNLGLNATPSAWGGSFKALQISNSSVYNNGGNDTFVGANFFWDGTNNKYIATDFAVAYGQQDGEHRFYTAPSGTAGNNATFTERMRLDTSGNLLVSTTSADARFSVHATNLTIPAISARYSAAGYKMGFGVYNVLGYPYLALNCNQVASSNNQTYDLSAFASKLDLAIDNTSGGFVFSTAASGTAGNTITWSERMRIDGATGNVGIGGTAAAFSRCNVTGTLPTSSNTSIGFSSNGTTPSGSTTNSFQFYSVASTQAASFTLANLYHYFAQQSTIGASSAVTNQFGFFVDSTLTGATNNYGFYSNIASGSNRWNFYAAGTANNYFAGNVGIGATPTAKLLVFTGSTADGIRIQRFAGNYYSELRQTDAQEGLAFLVGDGSTVAERLRIKGTGQTRFQPRGGNPGGAEAGDVYYDSNDNKLKVYNGTSWVDLH